MLMLKHRRCTAFINSGRNMILCSGLCCSAHVNRREQATDHKVAEFAKGCQPYQHQGQRRYSDSQ